MPSQPLGTLKLAEVHAAKVSIQFDALIADALAPTKLRRHPSYHAHRTQMAQLIDAQLNPALQRYIQKRCGPIPRTILRLPIRIRPVPRFRLAELENAIGSLLDQLASDQGKSLRRTDRRSYVRQTRAFVREFVLRNDVLAVMIKKTS